MWRSAEVMASKPPPGQELAPKEAGLFRAVVKFYEGKHYKKGIKAADQVRFARVCLNRCTRFAIGQHVHTPRRVCHCRQHFRCMLAAEKPVAAVAGKCGL